MQLKKRVEAEAEVDMTPMIDMVFLLLIFFMTAATLSKVDSTPEVKLPIAKKSVIPDDLRARGTINLVYLGSVTPSEEVVTKEKPFLVSGVLMNDKELQEAMIEKLKEEPELQLYMRIDRRVDFEYVRRGIASCAAAGVFDIIFASFQTRSGE